MFQILPGKPLILGKPVPTIIDDFLEKFQRGGEGGSFPIEKILLQNF